MNMLDDSQDSRSGKGPLPLVCLGLVVSLGCHSMEEQATAPLPFHVAILPVAVAPETAGGEEDPERSRDSAGSHDLQLTLDSNAVEAALYEALEGRRFSRVTLLSQAELDSVAPHDKGWNPVGNLAERIDADLILECRVTFAPKVTTRTNEKFWLNLPLFLMGGPMMYFIDDRSYTCDVRIETSVFDVQPIVSGDADLERGQSEYLYVESSIHEQSMDFIDRAGHWYQYLFSLIVPAGFLAKDGKAVCSHLSTHAAIQIAEGIAHEIERRSPALFAVGSVAEFCLDPSVAMERRGELIVIHGEVIRRVDAEVELSDVRLRCGSEETRGSLGAAIAGSPVPRARRYERYPLDGTVRASKGAAVRLTIEGLGRSRRVRTYTLLVSV